jgi:hypothetical protein
VEINNTSNSIPPRNVQEVVVTDLPEPTTTSKQLLAHHLLMPLRAIGHQHPHKRTDCTCAFKYNCPNLRATLIEDGLRGVAPSSGTQLLAIILMNNASNDLSQTTRGKVFIPNALHEKVTTREATACASCLLNHIFSSIPKPTIAYFTRERCSQSDTSTQNSTSLLLDISTLDHHTCCASLDR